MRVLHVDPERGWGGGETQVVALLRALGARGHECRLAADPAGALARAASALGVPVLALRVRNHLDLPAAVALRRLARGHEVVHFHTSRAHALAPLCRGLGARLVVTRRMDYVPSGGPYARFLYNMAVDVVIAISEGVRSALLRAGVRAERIRVVPSGVDPSRLVAPAGARERLRREWNVDPASVVVLVPGVLERRKGHAVLLAAAERLARSRRDLHYVLCGDGREAAVLRRAAERLDGSIRLLGFRDDIPACLAAADVVALPSLHEGLGVAALEAMAAERPVVASRVGGLAEAVVPEETGLLVPPGDATALAAALGRLADDAALRVRLGRGGRARVLGRYSNEQMADGTLACYGDAACR